MIEYQTYGFDSAGCCTHAGTVYGRIDAKRALKIQAEWEAWAAQYIVDHPGDYPLVHSVGKTVAFHVHPIGKPGRTRRFAICH